VVLAFLLSVAAVICRDLLFRSGFPAGWDAFAQHYWISFFSTDGQFLNLWEDMALGYPVPLTFWSTALSALSRLCRDVAAVARIWLTVTFCAIPLAMYAYAYRLTRRKSAAAVSAVVFMLNPWVLSHVANGHYAYVVAYIMLPLGLLAIEKVLRGGSLAAVLSLATVLAVLLSFRLDPIVYVLPSLLSYGLWLVIFSPSQVSPGWPGRLLLVGIVAVILTAYIWLPMAAVEIPHAGIRYSLETLRDTSLPLLPSLLGFGLVYSYFFWEGGLSFATHPLGSPVLFAMAGILSMGAFGASLTRKRPAIAAFFSLLALVSVFLGKGLHAPFGELYAFLYRVVPLMQRMHEPNRWLMLTWFSYATLLGLGAEWLTDRIGRLRGLIEGALVVATTCTLLVLSPYAVTSGFRVWQPPDTEVQAYEWLAQQPGSSRTLSIPFGFSRMFVPEGWIQHDLGYLSPVFTGKPALREHELGPTGQLLTHMQWLADRGRALDVLKLAGLLDGRYVVVHGYPPTQPNHTVYGRRLFGRVAQQDLFEGLSPLPLVPVFEGEHQDYVVTAFDRWEREITIHGKQAGQQVFSVGRPSRVYENNFWVPRAFSAKGTVIVVGGLEALSMMLSRFDNFVLSDWCIFFAHHLYEWRGVSALLELLSKADWVVMSADATLDLGLMLAGAVLLDASAHDGAGWTEDTQRAQRGELFYGAPPVISRKVRANLTFIWDCPEPGEYDVWVRAAGHGAASLALEVDGRWLGGVVVSGQPHMPLVWHHFRSLHLAQGHHVLRVKTSGISSIDALAIVDSGELEAGVERAAALTDGRALILDHATGGGGGERSLLDPTDWSSSWHNPDAAVSVRAVVAEELPTRPTVLRIEVSPREQELLLRRELSGEDQDWRSYAYLQVSFRGMGSGERFCIRLRFDGTDEDPAWVEYDILDTSSQWQFLRIPLLRYGASEGLPRWDSVVQISLQCPNKRFAGTVFFGEIALMRLDSGSLAAPAVEQTSVDVERISASRLRVSGLIDKPCTIVVSNSYHPLWRALAGGLEYEPMPAYYGLTAFRIDHLDDEGVLIEFRGQKYQIIGLWISGVASLGCLVLLVVGWARRLRTTCPRRRLTFRKG